MEKGKAKNRISILKVITEEVRMWSEVVKVNYIVGDVGQKEK